MKYEASCTPSLASYINKYMLFTIGTQLHIKKTEHAFNLIQGHAFLMGFL